MVKSINSKFLQLIVMLCSCNLMANVTGITNNNDVIAKMLEFKEDPNGYIFNYTDRPKEINLNQDNIESAALITASNNDDAKMIRDNFDKRPAYKFNHELLQDSKAIINNSDSIVNGISNEYIDCQKQQECKVVYDDEIKYCTSGKDNQIYKCEQGLQVNVVASNKVLKRIRVELRANSKYSGNFSYDLRKERLIASSVDNAQVKQDNNITDLSCDNFTMRIVDEGYLSDTFNTSVIKSIAIIQNCMQPILNINIDQGDYHHNKYKTRGVYVVIELSSETGPVITESLTNNCPEIDRRVKAGLCKFVSNTCLIPKETRVINGIDVTRDCWLYEAKYNCGTSDTTTSTCKTLENGNCIQVSSECSNYIDGMCSQFKQGYKCALNTCSGKIAVSCFDEQIINETIDKYTTSVLKEGADFATSVTKLSVISDAIKNSPKAFNEATPFIFKGHPMKCQKSGMGFKNCCKDSGWGVDLNLAECTEEEKELGAKKEHGLAIFVGENKHDRGNRVDKAYCVFDSKIAKLVQEHGRREQLGINFGSGKYPDCRAISPNELAKINLDKIDLSQVFFDATSKHQELNVDKTNSNMRDKIKKYYSDEVGNG